MSRVSVPKHSPSELLIRGATLSYLGVMVVLPLAVLTYQAAEPGTSAFWKAISNPFAWHALKLTVRDGAGDGGDQRGDWARRRPGSWSATRSPARAWSTR